MEASSTSPRETQSHINLWNVRSPGGLKQWATDRKSNPLLKGTALSGGLVLTIVALLGITLAGYILGTKTSLAALAGKVVALKSLVLAKAGALATQVHSMTTGEIIYKVMLPTAGATALGFFTGTGVFKLARRYHNHMKNLETEYRLSFSGLRDDDDGIRSLNFSTNRNDTGRGNESGSGSGSDSEQD